MPSRDREKGLGQGPARVVRRLLAGKGGLMTPKKTLNHRKPSEAEWFDFFESQEQAKAAARLWKMARRFYRERWDMPRELARIIQDYERTINGIR
jgi:hypothetical protein